MPDWLKTGCFVVASLCLIGGLFVMCAMAQTIVPQNNENNTRANVARVMSDMRNIATALETYKINNGQFPAWNPAHHVLTTPVGYLMSMPQDPFAPKGASGADAMIQFRTNESEYLIWSVGPDGEAQISGDDDLNGSREDLLHKNYDVMNGTISPGDIYRRGPGPETGAGVGLP